MVVPPNRCRWAYTLCGQWSASTRFGHMVHGLLPPPEAAAIDLAEQRSASPRKAGRRWLEVVPQSSKSAACASLGQAAHREQQRPAELEISLHQRASPGCRDGGIRTHDLDPADRGRCLRSQGLWRRTRGRSVELGSFGDAQSVWSPSGHRVLHVAPSEGLSPLGAHPDAGRSPVNGRGVGHVLHVPDPPSAPWRLTRPCSTPLPCRWSGTCSRRSRSAGERRPGCGPSRAR